MRHTLSKTIYNEQKGTEENKEISVERQQGTNCEIRITSESSTIPIILKKQELSDFIGLMLHVQGQIKRNQ